MTSRLRCRFRPPTGALPRLPTAKRICVPPRLGGYHAQVSQFRFSSSPSSLFRPSPFFRTSAIGAQQFCSRHLSTDHKNYKPPAKSPGKSVEPSMVSKAVTSVRKLPKAITDFLKASVQLMVSRDKQKAAYASIKAHAIHYWNSSKLLGTNIATSWRLMKRVLHGKSLTRRERKQLLRTAGDMARIVPLLFFFLVPFMELLLPFALKLFPNMLPSTFQDKLKKAELQKKQLKARINMARFLQDTVQELAEELETKGNDKNEKLVSVLTKVRSGQYVRNDDLLSVSCFFSDQITLDNASRETLETMCRYMGLRPYGPDGFLRTYIKNKLASIQRDDVAIKREGMDHWTIPELEAACRERGIRSSGLENQDYQDRLQGWIDLSLNKKIPPTLLILSRAFNITATSGPQNISKAIRDLEESAVDEVLVEEIGVDDMEKEREVIQRQNQLIEEERKEQERQASAEAERLRRLSEISGKSASGKQPKSKSSDDPIKKKQQIVEALSVMTADSAVEWEKEDLEELQAKQADLQEDLADLAEQEEMDDFQEQLLAEANQSRRVDLETPEIASSPEALQKHDAKISASSPSVDDEKSQPTTADDGFSSSSDDDDDEDDEEKSLEKTTKNLGQRLDKMLEQLEKDIDKAGKDIGSDMRVMDDDKDGVVSFDEVKQVIKRDLKVDMDDDDAIEKLCAELDTKGDGKLDVHEIEEIAKEIDGVGQDDEVDDSKAHNDATK